MSKKKIIIYSIIIIVIVVYMILYFIEEKVFNKNKGHQTRYNKLKIECESKGGDYGLVCFGDNCYMDCQVPRIK